MFEVRILVEDKRLPKLLWALDGQIVDQPQIVPVRGAEVSKGPSGSSKVRATTSGQTMNGALTECLANNKIKTINTKELGDLVEQMGYQRGGAGATITHLVKDGVLIRTSHGEYKTHLRAPNKQPRAKPAKRQKTKYVGGHRLKSLRAWDLIIQLLQAAPDGLAPKQMAQGFKQHGFAPNSVSPALAKLIDEGRVRNENHIYHFVK